MKQVIAAAIALSALAVICTPAAQAQGLLQSLLGAYGGYGGAYAPYGMGSGYYPAYYGNGYAPYGTGYYPTAYPGYGGNGYGYPYGFNGYNHFEHEHGWGHCGDDDDD